MYFYCIHHCIAYLFTFDDCLLLFSFFNPHRENRESIGFLISNWVNKIGSGPSPGSNPDPRSISDHSCSHCPDPSSHPGVGSSQVLVLILVLSVVLVLVLILVLVLMLVLELVLILVLVVVSVLVPVLI